MTATPVRIMAMAICALTVHSAAGAQTSWKNGAGKPVEDSHSMKSREGFGGAVLATPDDDWRAKWDTPPETKPSFTKAGTVAYGKKVYILTFFSNPKLNADGKARVRCDIRLQDPAGKIVVDQMDMSCYDGPLKGSQYNLRLSAPVIEFSGDPGDPPGTWLVEVKLRDAVRRVELPLRSSFELK